MGTPEHVAGLQFIREWLETEPLIEPTVHSLDQIVEVERAMEQGRTIGKVVLKV